jgi:hypothetical protein
MEAVNLHFCISLNILRVIRETELLEEVIKTLNLFLILF